MFNLFTGYAKFGKVTETEDTAVKADSGGSVHGLFTPNYQCPLDPAVQSDSFKPSRRVRTVPGGPHTDIFTPEDVGDALSRAPPMPVIDAQVRPKVLLHIFSTFTLSISRRVPLRPNNLQPKKRRLALTLLLV